MYIFNNNEMAFDKNIVIEDDEQLSQLVNYYNSLIDKIKLNLFVAMNHYWNNLISSDMLLSNLLDSKMKDLSFVTITECLATENLLKEKYEELKFQD